MASGIPVATVAIGDAGAKNAALLAIQILGMNDAILQQKIVDYRNELKQAVSENYNFDLD